MSRRTEITDVISRSRKGAWIEIRLKYLLK